MHKLAYFVIALYHLPLELFCACRALVRHFLLPGRIERLLRDKPPHCDYCLGYAIAPLLAHTYTFDGLAIMYASKTKAMLAQDVEVDDVTYGVVCWINDNLPVQV